MAIYWVQTNEDMNPVRVNLSSSEVRGVIKVLEALADQGELVELSDENSEIIFDNYDDWSANRRIESYKREAYDGQSFYKAIKNDFITAYCAAYGCSKREAEQTYKDCVREGASGLRYMQAVVDDFKDNAKRTFYDD